MAEPAAGGEPPQRVPALGGPFEAEVVVPGSKSLTNRALICAALAAGPSRLEGALVADDTAAMADGLNQLGAGVTLAATDDPQAREAREIGDDGNGASDPVITVTGTGGHLVAGPRELDARLSGTTSRFLLPVLALGTGPYRLTGDEALLARPMDGLLDALAHLGASVGTESTPGHLPATVSGPLTGGAVTVPGDTSSQFLSGLLLAGPAMADGLEVTVGTELVSAPYVALTTEVMAAFGAEVTARSGSWRVTGTGYRARRFAVEPDASAASYFFAAAALCGGRVRVPGIGHTSHQGDLALTGILEAMGAEVEIDDEGTTVTGTGRLSGGTFDLSAMPDMAQTLAAIAPFASEPVEITGVGFIRGHETDRIAAVVTELTRLGASAEATADGLRIRPSTPGPGTVRTYRDHRMAMSFAVLGLRTGGVSIAEPDCVTKTFPGFFAALEALATGVTASPRQ